MVYTNNIAIIFLSLFVFSLPFNGVELDVIGVNRFEIKITMITFILLTVIWIGTIKKYGTNYKNYEVTIYAFLLMYLSTQYISIATSNFKIDSLQQSIIITLFVFIMLVSSQLITNHKIAHYVIISMGITCIIFSIIKMIVFIYFSDEVRLGQSGDNVLINKIFRGDPTYFGDIVLFGLGPFYYLIITFCRRPIGLLLSIPFQVVIFSFTVCTQSKGVILSVMIFLLFSLIFLKGWRRFMLLSCILYIALLILFTLTNIRDLLTITPSHEDTDQSQSAEYIFIDEPDIYKSSDINERKKIYEENDLNIVDQISTSLPMISENSEKYIDDIVDALSKSRLNVLSPLGINSYHTRLKAIKVTFVSSVEQILFGHGAGTSQKLLPKIIDEYELKNAFSKALADSKEIHKMSVLEHKYYTGESFGKWIDSTAKYSNKTLIDAHNIFITEIFNVGLLGALSLFIAIIIIIYKQLEVIKIYKYKNNYMNELLLLTLLSMLMNRMTDSLIAIPFLWFILGINLGLIKLRTGYK